MKAKKQAFAKGKPGDYIRIPRNTPVQFKNDNNNEKLIMLVPTTPPYNVIAQKTNWKVETLLDPKQGYWQK